jgi:hypothetical protein
MKIEELDDQELYELAQSVIGCRISLRSSGKVPEDDRGSRVATTIIVRVESS